MATTQEIETARYRDVRSYVLFIGYQQSGHSIVGALLDAHPDAIIAHEMGALAQVEAGVGRLELFKALLVDAREQVAKQRQSYKYNYYIPDSWQGRSRFIHAIGDKQGGVSASKIAQHPALLDKLRDLVEVPVRVLHVIRNPYDNVASMAIRGQRPLYESACRYVTAVNNVLRVREHFGDDDWLDIRQERLLARPRETMQHVCEFLRLEPKDDYLELCEKQLFSEPNRTQEQMKWDRASLVRLKEVIARASYLEGYPAP